jgi:hypothetical protein
MDFGDEPEGSDSQRRRKRYHRHTPRQIQQLEAYALPPLLPCFFWLCNPILLVIDGME